jgi:hypothetical protein
MHQQSPLSKEIASRIFSERPTLVYPCLGARELTFFNEIHLFSGLPFMDHNIASFALDSLERLSDLSQLPVWQWCEQRNFPNDFAHVGKVSVEPLTLFHNNFNFLTSDAGAYCSQDCVELRSIYLPRAIDIAGLEGTDQCGCIVAISIATIPMNAIASGFTACTSIFFDFRLSRQTVPGGVLGPGTERVRAVHTKQQRYSQKQYCKRVHLSLWCRCVRVRCLSLVVRSLPLG